MIEAIQVPMVDHECALVAWDARQYDIQQARDTGVVLFLPVSTCHALAGNVIATAYVLDPKCRAPCKLPPSRMLLVVYEDPIDGARRVAWQQCPSQFILRSMVEGNEDTPWLLCMADYDQGKPRVMWFNAVPEQQVRHAS